MVILVLNFLNFGYSQVTQSALYSTGSEPPSGVEHYDVVDSVNTLGTFTWVPVSKFYRVPWGKLT